MKQPNTVSKKRAWISVVVELGIAINRKCLTGNRRGVRTRKEKRQLCYVCRVNELLHRLVGECQIHFL
jgi:hypothetical protein